MHRRMIALLAALLLACGLFVSVGGTTTARAATGTITLTVDCYADPERTTITNNTDATIDLGLTSLGQGYTLASLHRPRPPLRLFGAVAPGEAITFETGPGAARNVLTRDELYDNQTPDEGARFGTRASGGLTVLCSAQTGTLAVSTPSNTAGASGSAPAPLPNMPNTGGGGARTPVRAGNVGLILLALGTLGGAILRRYPRARR